MDEKENFIQLDLSESGNKFSTLVLNGAELKIWIPEQESFTAKILEGSYSSSSDHFAVTLKSQLDFSKWKGNKVLFSFNMIGMLFFGEAQIENWEVDNSFKLKVSNGIYRFEKRKSDRLLTYPRYRSYCYFNFESEGDNVAYINRTARKVEETFKSYISKKSLVDKDGKPLSGLRVLDISEGGISFVANSKEIALLGEDELSLVVELDGQRYEGKGKAIYTVDYIDPRISNVRMYKVGMVTTDLGDEFSQNLRSLLGETVELVKPESHFENFLK